MPQAISVTKTFELSVSAGGLTDENTYFEVKATAEVAPYIPPQVTTMRSPRGQPAEGGYAEITHLTYTEELGVFTSPGRHRKTHDISWLIDILPTSLIESWQLILYEQYTKRGERAL